MPLSALIGPFSRVTTGFLQANLGLPQHQTRAGEVQQFELHVTTRVCLTWSVGHGRSPSSHPAAPAPNAVFPLRPQSSSCAQPRRHQRGSYHERSSPVQPSALGGPSTVRACPTKEVPESGETATVSGLHVWGRNLGSQGMCLRARVCPTLRRQTRTSRLTALRNNSCERKDG